MAERRTNSALLAPFSAAAGVACLVALHEVGLVYRGFVIRQEGVNYLAPSELVFSLWYALWGTLATACFAFALARTPLPAGALAFFGRVRARPWWLVGGVALIAACWAAALHRIVLLGHPVADDESVLAFQAQTLLHGRLINPLPDDPERFVNQYIFLDGRGWYGKYPIGHPLVLALGEALGARWLVGPVLAALVVALTFLVGRKLFDTPRALLGATLLCLSPQFVATHATQLSQTSSALAMLAGVWALMRLADRPGLGTAALAGALWGFALLVRPMPGALFLIAAIAGHLALAVERPAPPPWRAWIGQLVAAAPGVLAAAALLFWLNTLQTGSAVTSSYQANHGNLGIFDRQEGLRAISVGAALLRQNFWLFGWTLSLVFVPFGRPERGRVLFWGLVGAAYAYRWLVPKTVVASTGPIYVFEIVPLLALATADGAARVATLLGRLSVARPREQVAATMIAASLVAAVAFVPVHATALLVGARMRDRVHVALAARGAERALVFANELVEPEWGATWAYFPPNPSPDLDDAVLFARFEHTPEGLRSAHAFWRKHFPGRRAFFYVDVPARGPIFEELQLDAPPQAGSPAASD